MINKIFKQAKLKSNMKIKQTIILAIIISLFLLPVLCLAQIQTLSTSKINTNIQLTQSVTNSTYCNLTKIQYPNNTVLNVYALMTKQGNDYNYTFYTTTLGEHSYITCCNPDGIETCVGVTFLITNSGYDANITQGIMIFFIFGVVIVLATLFFIIGLRTEFMGAKLFFLSMTVILMVFLIGYIVNVTHITLGEFPSLTSGFTPLYILFIALLTVGAIGLIVYLIAYSLQAFYKSRGFRD